MRLKIIESLKAVTRNCPRLTVPSSTPADEQWVYGIALPFQLGPTEAALFCNIRLDGMSVDDLEAGNDLVILDQLDLPQNWRVAPLNRGEFAAHPATGQKMRLSKYPVTGGFVPLNARRANGSPHPHAGTGFGLSTVIGFPADFSVKWVGEMKDPLAYFEWHQYEYDGQNFRITQNRPVQCEDLLPGWRMSDLGLSNAIPDGDDLLLGMVGSRRGEPSAAGLSRWRRVDGGWRIVEFQPVTGPDHSQEPTLVRDIDGSLLFTARGCCSYRVAPGQQDNSQSIRIWRSRDDGVSWELMIHLPDARPPTPVTLNRSADATPYVAFNPLRWTGERPRQPGMAREFLELHPLSEDRRSLLPPLLVRDGHAEFGSAPNGSRWCIDHPIGSTVRLRDGKWRHLLAYRVMDIAESAGASPTPFTGCYVEEVIDLGATAPPPERTWNVGA